MAVICAGVASKVALTANILAAQAELPVPLAVENIASLVSWPEDEFTEADFLNELVERTGVLLLLDVANLYTAQVNFGLDPAATLDRLPLSEVAYVHVAGGELRDGIWHDTHAHPVTDALWDDDLEVILDDYDGHLSIAWY